MIVCVVDAMNKQVVLACNEDEFRLIANRYGKPVLYLSLRHPFFITEGYLFTCQPPQ